MHTQHWRALALATRRCSGQIDAGRDAERPIGPGPGIQPAAAGSGATLPGVPSTPTDTSPGAAGAPASQFSGSTSLNLAGAPQFSRFGELEAHGRRAR